MTRQRIALVASIIGSGIVLLDSTIVNVALPAIRASLHGTLAQQQWVVEAYLLLMSSLLLIGGSLGDLFGRRRVFSLGLMGFGACSALCALAPSGGVLIVARGLQGAAGALLVPSTLALIVDTFAEGHERAAAIGTWTAYTGLATVIGPFGGGLLIQFASWRWIFGVNLPLVVLVLELLRRLPDDRRAPGHVDLPGAALCALGLGGPVFALIEQPSHGWGSPVVLIPLIAGVALFAGFLAWERRSPDPMLPLGLFASRNFAAGNLMTLLMYAGLGVMTFFLVVFLQQVGGYRPLAAGLALLPVTALMFLFSLRAGALADRLGPHWFLAGGPVLAGIGLLLFLRIGPHPSYVTEVLPAMLVFGVGLTGTVAPLTATVLGAVAPGHAGLASGVNNAVARTASLLAIAAVGAVVSAAFIARLPSAAASPVLAAALRTARTRPLVTTVPGRLAAPAHAALHRELTAASVHAFHVAVVVAGILAILGGLIALAGIRNLRAAAPAAGHPDPTPAAVPVAAARRA